MADVTREQLTAALERLGCTVRVDAVLVGNSREHECACHSRTRTIRVRGETEDAALAAALRALVPLDVLVRAVMEGHSPGNTTVGEYDAAR